MAGAADAARALGLTPDLLRRLDRLAILSRRPAEGGGSGQRRARRPGSSPEFADYRSYVPGDDFRRVDWNAYARSDRLVIRLFVGEEDVCVTCWVDVSASMEWGDPSKARCARALAAAISYVVLGGYDRAACVAFAGGVVGRSPAVRGRAGCAQLWHALTAFPAGGGTDFSAVARAARSVPRGVAFLISDFLTEAGPRAAVAALREAGHHVILLQVLAAQELRPDLRGDVRLRDVESGAAVEVTATAAVLAEYAAALRAHVEGLRRLAAAHGAVFAGVDAGVPLQQLLVGDLRRAGVLR